MLLTEDKKNKSYEFVGLFAEKFFDNEIAEIFRDDLFSFGIDKNDYDFATTQSYDADGFKKVGVKVYIHSHTEHGSE